MRNLDEIKNLIDEKAEYYEAKALSLNVDYFGDEVRLCFDCGGSRDTAVLYTFLECYNVKIFHSPSYTDDKPTKNLSHAQKPYFITYMDVDEVNYYDEEIKKTIKLLRCKFYMCPIDVEIWFKELLVTNVDYPRE